MSSLMSRSVDQHAAIASVDAPPAEQSNMLQPGFSTNVQLSCIDEFDSLIHGMFTTPV
jgi:hypothetical protein